MNAMHAILAATAMCAAPTFAIGAADPHSQLPADLRQAAADFDRAQLHSDTAELQRLVRRESARLVEQQDAVELAEAFARFAHGGDCRATTPSGRREA
jgi:hypothetical protein